MVKKITSLDLIKLKTLVLLSKSIIMIQLHEWKYRGFITRCNPLVTVILKTVLWTEEIKINLYQDDGEKTVNTEKTHGGGNVKAWCQFQFSFRGNVIAWACMTG